MPSPISKIFIGLFMLLAVASCRDATVYNVENLAINTPPRATLSDVEGAIKRAGASLGWQMRKVGKGHIVAQLPIRTHTAIADVTFTTKEFSIRYKNSSNLKYDASANTIHSNYNSWVRNLQNAILSQTAALS
jgi:hypothetical protein